MTSLIDQASLRRQSLAARGLIDGEERRRAAYDAASRALRALAARPGMIAVFLPISDEIDTRPLIHSLAGQGLALCLPVVDELDTALSFRAYVPGLTLVRGAFGVQVPSSAVPLTSPDTLFVPLSAFDRLGGRIGYGRGFYDRSLRSLRARKKVHAIGYAFACQEVACVPMDEHDERLDQIITEKEVITPRPPF